MAWPTLVPPTAGTVITVAREVAMNNDPLLWLRLLTGNADPPGPFYVVVSAGPASTAWSKVTADVLGPGAAVGNLGYTPVNRAGDTMTGILVALKNTGAFDAGLYARAGLYVETTDGSRPAITFARDGVGALALAFESGSQLFLMSSGGVGSIVWHSTNDGINSGLDADLWRGQTPAAITVGNATNAATASTATTADNANALAGFPAGNGANQIPISNGVPCAGLVAAAAGSATTATTAANANALGGFSYSNVPAANTVPVVPAGGTLDAWVTPTAAAPVPSGLVAFITNASLPTGWSFYTAANGRVLVAAGTASVTNAQTFAVGGSYGGDWAHGHTVNIQHAHSISATHQHGATALGVGGSIGGPTAVNGLASAGGVNLPTDTHGHSHTLDVTGTTDAATSSGTDNGGSTAQSTTGVVWIPPAHALNAIIKT